MANSKTNTHHRARRRITLLIRDIVSGPLPFLLSLLTIVFIFAIIRSSRQVTGLDPFETRPFYIFLHIPKTAGTTFRLRIAKYNSELPPSSSSILSSTTTYHSQTTRAPLIVCRFYSNQLPSHPDGVRFLELEPEEQMHYDMLIGHLQHGVHTHQGFHLGKKIGKKRPLRYMTFLREPVDRTVSLYYYYRNIPNLSDPSIREVANRTLGEWMIWNLERQNGNASDRCNLQTQYLSGILGIVDVKTLLEAKRNLETLWFFGLQDRFAESLLLLRYRTGWKLPEEGFDSSNVKPRPELEKEDTEAISLIERCNSFDIELYRHAVQLFELRLRQHLPWDDDNFSYSNELQELKSKMRYVRPLAPEYVKKDNK
jgi:hypothetical protein